MECIDKPFTHFYRVPIGASTEKTRKCAVALFFRAKTSLSTYSNAERLRNALPNCGLWASPPKFTKVMVRTILGKIPSPLGIKRAKLSRIPPNPTLGSLSSLIAELESALSIAQGLPIVGGLINEVFGGVLSSLPIKVPASVCELTGGTGVAGVCSCA